jgi:hypothetical protein
MEEKTVDPMLQVQLPSIEPVDKVHRSSPGSAANIPYH